MKDLSKTDILIMLGILTIRYTTTRLNFPNVCGIENITTKNLI